MRARLTTVLVLAALAGNALPAAQATAASPGCHVRNVTQGTTGRSLRSMAASAWWGDRLLVRGTCRGTVVIRRGMVIRGIGRRRAVITGEGRPPAVVRVRRGAHAVLRHVEITGSSEAGGIENSGHLVLHGVVVRRNGQVRGGISNAGTMRVVDSLIADNHAWGGGGIGNGGTMVLRRSVVRDNEAWDGSGGGITNRGRLWLIGSVVRHNLTTYVMGGGRGGGIENEGRVVLRRSKILGNRADGWGAGGIGNSGTLIIRGSIVAHNVARSVDWDGETFGGAGGGIVNERRLVLRGSTVSANTADADGGGIENRGDALLLDSRVTDNLAGGTGGGIWNDADPADGVGTVTLLGSSAITGNTPDDCSGTVAC